MISYIPDYILKALFVVVGLLLMKQLFALLKLAQRRWSRAVLHAAAGLAALFTANTVGTLFGLGVGLNELTLPVSAVLGVPGVALLWGMKYLL